MGGTWEQEYDLRGRPVRGERREGGEVVAGFTTTYDVLGCPVGYTTTGPDDMGSVGTSSWRQTCGPCGYVDAVYAEDERIETWRNTCDVTGKLVAIDIADADEEPWAHIAVGWQAARVVSWVQTDSDSGREVWRQDYTFNADGWIRTYAEDGERRETWTYDTRGRAVGSEGSESLAYGYASDTSVFPERVTGGGRSGTIQVECD